MGITLFIIVTLIFGTYILSKVNGKKAAYAILATAAMAFILLGISLITKDILIPIGKKADDVIGGTIITLTIIAGLIFGVKLLNKVNGKLALWGVAATAVLAVIYMGITLITKDLLIPIG